MTASATNLVKGELRKISPAGSRQGAYIARLTGAIVTHVEANELGEVFGAETGFRLASEPDIGRAPDVAFICAERVPAGEITEKFWPSAPDLAVEVVSPSNTFYEVDEQIEDYLAAGVRLVWIINPKRRTLAGYRPNIEVQTITAADTLTGDDGLPGFQYELRRLFATKRA